MADSMRHHRFSPRGVKSAAKRALLTGFALTIPIFVTLLVIGFVVNSLSNILDPIVVFTFELTGSRLQPSETPAYVLKLVALAVLLVTVFSIGFVAERRSGSSRLESIFDAAIQRIPGIGSLYTSFDQMSEMLLDSDTQSFQEVVLVEHPTPESYTVAFVTASTPSSIERATGNEEMVTLFMPMAPNPVMGGHVLHVPAHKVYDLDMTVEEGIRSIVTSGVAIGESGVQPSLGESADAAASDDPHKSQYGPGDERRDPVSRTDSSDWAEAYRAEMKAENAETPESVARHQQNGTVGDESERPEDLNHESETLGDDTARPEAFDQSDKTVGDESKTPTDIESEGKGQN